MGGLSLVVVGIFSVFFGVKLAIKLMVPFVISAVVAYRLLDIRMDLGVESAAAFGSWPQR
jgi:hypothetical protein